MPPEPPSRAWLGLGKWFESVADMSVEHGGFRGAREISGSGTKDLPMGTDSITGYSTINAESLDDAEWTAQGNPFAAGTWVYKIKAE